MVQHSLLALQSACAGLSVLDKQGDTALMALANNQVGGGCCILVHELTCMRLKLKQVVSVSCYCH